MTAAPQPADEPALDTAHQVWEEWWADPGMREPWSRPEPDVLASISVLRARGAGAVLDVGAGVGRHALAFARSGFDVVATDASPTGLAELDRNAAAEGLSVVTRIAPFTAHPVDDASVDHVLAWNVLYHGDGSIVRAAFAECRRVLRDGGTFGCTMLSKRHRAFGLGRRVAPDTFVDDDSADDKTHPHFYVDEATLVAMLAESGFRVETIADVDQEPEGGFHWTVLATATSTGTGTSTGRTSH